MNEYIICLDIATGRTGYYKEELWVFWGKSGIGIGNNVDVTAEYDYQLYLACFAKCNLNEQMPGKMKVSEPWCNQNHSHEY